MKSLPRQLNHGEFYCHQCEKYVPMANHANHQQEHNIVSKKQQTA